MKNKAKVHRLPTEEITNVLVNTYIDPEKHSQSPVFYIHERNKVHLESKGEVKTIQSRGFKFQHLYFTTDEEIKEGNWYYSVTLNNIFKATNKMLPIFGGEKIIASTDPKLLKRTNWVETDVQGHWECTNCGEWTEDLSVKCKCKPVNKIPQSFIEEYCKAGGIDEVLVELESIQEIHVDGVIKQGVKLNPDNTIIIHPVEEKMYTLKQIKHMFDIGRDSAFQEMHFDEAIKYRDNELNKMD